MSELWAYLSPDIHSYFSGFYLYIILSGLGFVVGILAGLFGVGGGFLLVPLMNVFLGIPLEAAAGSATCYIIGTSTTGVFRHWKKNNIEFAAAFYISIGSMTGAVSGDMFQDFIINAAGGNRVVFDRIMQALFFLVLLLIAWIMSRNESYDEASDISAVTFLQKMKLGPDTNLEKSRQPGVSIAGLFIIGLAGGFLTGLMGVSGGVLFLPILVLGVGIRPHLAVGTSMAVVFISSVTAVIKKAASGSGKISLPVAMALLFAGTAGVRIGIALGQRLGGSSLKRYFSFVILAAALIVLFKFIYSMGIFS